MTLQLVDRSLKYPRGILNDVLVRVGSFIFPADFVVLDMKEDKDVPIILGRPFLATSSAVIDVKQEIVTLEFDGEKLTFNIFRSMQYPTECIDNFKVHTIENLVQTATNKIIEGKDDEILEALVLVDDADIQRESRRFNSATYK